MTKRVRQNKRVKAQRKTVPLESALEDWAVGHIEPGINWCIKVGLRGWPDRLVILGSGRHFWLEFKRRKFGSLTPAQRRLIPQLKARGEPVYVVKTRGQVLDAILTEAIK